MRTVALLALVVSLMVIATAAPVAGQDSNATATPTGTSTATATPTSSSSSVAQVDPALVVAGYLKDDGDLVIVFRAEVSRVVTISEAVTDSSGAGEFRIKQTTVPRGESRVRFPATEVSITTSQSIERGKGVYIDADGAGNPVKSLSSMQALGTGAAVMLGWMLVGAVRYIGKEGGAPEVAQ